MTKEELQELIDNFDIDKYMDEYRQHWGDLSMRQSLFVEELTSYRKQDYKSLLDELDISHDKFGYGMPDLSYIRGRDEIHIIDRTKYYAELVYHINDLEGIRKGVEFLRGKQ